MKQKLALIGIGLAIIAALLVWESFSDGGFSPASEEGYVSDIDGKITRAEMAKMISLLVYTRDELESLERVIIYEDTTEDKWYDKYINSIYTMGLLSEEESQAKEYQPMGYVTFTQLKELVNHIVIQKEMEGRDMTSISNEISAKIEEIQGNKGESDYVTRLKWLEVYEIIYTRVYESEPEQKELYILEAWENSESMEKWQVATNKGNYYCDGLNFIPYKDMAVKVLMQGNEIICLTEHLEEADIELSNVWLIGKKDGKLRIFVNGCEKEYALAGETTEDLTSKIGNLILTDNKVSKISIKSDRISGRVLQTGDDYIEIEKYGKVKLSENFCIYKVYDQLEMEPVKAILVGYDNAEFVMEDDKICAAIIKGPIEAENIRVLLKTDNFAGIIHDEVKVTADADFIIYYGDEKKKYEKGEEVTIKPDSELMKEGRLSVKTKGEDSKITILSIQRNQMAPSYRGTIEVALEGEGMTIVNELSLEKYLYAVIPSEMPTSYGTEALKVQAICARSYAYKQLMANSCSAYGAHVDDSYSYQVYNNIPENEVSIEAVKETYGKVLQYEGEIITAYYFSTSCGHTANAHEVWNSAEQVPYLTGKLQTKTASVEENTEETGTEEKAPDLSDEKTFKAFITEDTYDTYEEEMAWYRWSVNLSKKALKKSIDKNLGDRYEANSKLIQTLQEDGSYLSVPVDTVGEVKEIRITSRKTGGIITEIVIVGSKNTVKVMTEYNIRTILAPISSTIVRQDKSKVEGLSMLPSAFFILEEKEKDGKFSGYKVIGGGYGHGVGMSQNGAKAMVDDGKTCEEVLKHFYQGVQIGVIYNDWNCDH